MHTHTDTRVRCSLGDSQTPSPPSIPTQHCKRLPCVRPRPSSGRKVKSRPDRPLVQEPGPACCEAQGWVSVCPDCNSPPPGSLLRGGEGGEERGAGEQDRTPTSVMEPSPGTAFAAPLAQGVFQPSLHTPLLGLQGPQGPQGWCFWC